MNVNRRTAAGDRKRPPPTGGGKLPTGRRRTRRTSTLPPMADVMPPSDELFELIRLGSWEAAIDRCRSHPRDAEWRRPIHPSPSGENLTPMGGWLPIHMAISAGAPADVVRAVLAANPSLIDAGVTSSNMTPIRMTPIHMLSKAIPFGGENENERSQVLGAFIERFPPSREELGRLLAPLPLLRDAVSIIASFLPNPALVTCWGFYPIHMFLLGLVNEGCVRSLASACPASLGVCSQPKTAIHQAVQAMIDGGSRLTPLEDLVDLAGDDALTAREAYTGDTPLHMACRANEPSNLNDAVLTLLWREPGAAAVRNHEGKTPLECFLASRTYGEGSVREQIFVNDRSTRVLEELAKARPSVLLEPPGTARPDDWPEGVEWTMYTFLQATMAMNCSVGPHLLSILGDAVERHVGKKRRRLYAVPPRDTFYSLLGGVADLRLPSAGSSLGPRAFSAADLS